MNTCTRNGLTYAHDRKNNHSCSSVSCSVRNSNSSHQTFLYLADISCRLQHHGCKYAIDSYMNSTGQINEECLSKHT